MKLPKIAIVGYGSMGKEIEKIAKDKGFEITDIFDEFNQLIESKKYQFEVAIDFSVPSAVVNNVQILSKMKKNIVLGTTGWNENYDLISKIVNENGNCLIWGSNFSVGMLMFFEIVKQATKLVNIFDDYDIFGTEIHHHRKKDSPSGTAISLANIIMSESNKKNEVLFETSHTAIQNEQLHFTSTRGGEIPGTHTIFIDSIADTLELTHRARNRSGFALGALKAVTLCKDRIGVFEFTELLEIN